MRLKLPRAWSLRSPSAKSPDNIIREHVPVVHRVRAPSTHQQQSITTASNAYQARTHTFSFP